MSVKCEECGQPKPEPPFKTDRIGVCWWCGGGLRPGCCGGPPKSLLEFLRAEAARLRRALEALEWCGRERDPMGLIPGPACPSCLVSKFSLDGKPGKHGPECLIAAALAAQGEE